MLREYFVGVIYVSLFIAIALALSHPKLKNATVFGAGVLLISSIMLPLVDIFRDFDVNESFEDIFDGIDYEATDSAIELAFEDGVGGYVAEKYGVDKECVSVRADGFDIASLTAERIYVTLVGEAMILDYKKIEEEVASKFTSGGECEVYVSFG